MAGNLIAFVVCLPWALPPSGDAQDWILIVYLGVVQIGLAYLLLAAAVRHVPAFEVSLLLLVEPALNPVWSWLVHGETPSGVAIAGGVLILGATAAKVWLRLARGPPPPGTSPRPLPPRRDAGGGRRLRCLTVPGLPRPLRTAALALAALAAAAPCGAAAAAPLPEFRAVVRPISPRRAGADDPERVADGLPGRARRRCAT